MNKPKPNFFIIGAARAATTTLYHVLNQHPNVFMANVKEPNFFNQSWEEVEQGWGGYLNLFEQAKNEKVIGEASTHYLYDYKQASANIKRKVDDLKILVQLRDPVERAISHYRLQVRNRNNSENLNLKEVLANEIEQEGIDSEIPYFRMGLYYNQLKEFIDTFGQSSVKITLFKKFKRNPEETLKSICEFLEISPQFLPDEIKKYNASNEIRFNWISNFFGGDSYSKKILKIIIPERPRKIIASEINSNLNLSSSKIEVENEAEVKKWLYKKYKSDINKLEELLDKDLNHWQ